MDTVEPVRAYGEADLAGFLLYVVRALVDRPDDVRIEDSQTGSVTTYGIAVAGEDIGKVIGRHGRVAQSLRSVSKALAGRDHRRVFVDILD